MSLSRFCEQFGHQYAPWPSALVLYCPRCGDVKTFDAPSVIIGDPRPDEPEQPELSPEQLDFIADLVAKSGGLPPPEVAAGVEPLEPDEMEFPRVRVPVEDEGDDRIPPAGL